MSHTFQLSDEQYAKFRAYAAQQKQTPEALFQAWIGEALHHMEEPTSSRRTKQGHRNVQERTEDEILNSPLLQVAGMFAIGEPGWADAHDEYLAEAYIEDHADNS